MVEAADPDPIQHKRKAISALFPYAVALERRGQRGMLDAFSRAARASNSDRFMWWHIKPFIATLFIKPDPPSLSWVLGLISPRLLWHDQPHDDLVVAWPAAGPSYAEEADRSLVDELLRLAFVAPMRPFLPITHHELSRRFMGTGGDLVRQVRALGDIRVLKSYLILAWSDWDHIRIHDQSEGFAEMEISIQEDFSGIGMGRHREGLIKRLDHVLERLDHLLGRDKPENISVQRAAGYDKLQMVKESYKGLKRVLLEVGGAAKMLGTSQVDYFQSTDICAYRIPLNLHVRSASPMISHPGKFKARHSRLSISSDCHCSVPSTPVASVRTPPKFTRRTLHKLARSIYVVLFSWWYYSRGPAWPSHPVLG